MEKSNIYILQLEGDKYYVGRSGNPEKRINDHFRGGRSGSIWTRIHKPVEVMNIYENVSPFEEDRYTLELMDKYGIDNVRGGTYCQEHLSSQQRDFIQKSIWSAKNFCLNCGSPDHFSRLCQVRSETEEPDTDEKNWTDSIRLSLETIKTKITDAITAISNIKTSDTRENIEMDEKTDTDSPSEHPVSEKKEDIMRFPVGTCFRCGRTSHFAYDCFAKTDINGRKL